MNALAYVNDGVLYVDNTTLSTLATCPTKAMVRYGYNLKPNGWSAAPLQAGIAIHQAIEAHYTGGSLDHVLQVLQDAYYEWAVANVDITDRLGYNNVKDCVESWVLRNPVTELPYTIPTNDHVEMPFDLQLNPKDPSIRFVGRIDALVSRKLGHDIDSPYIARDALYVLDTKSTGQPFGRYEAQFYLSPQLTGYTWAAQQMFPEAQIVGCYINIVHTYMIPRQSGKCRKHNVSYDECRFLHPNHMLIGPLLRSKGELEEWRIDAYALALRWKNMLMEQGLLEGRTRSLWDMRLVPQYGKFVYQACSLCELLDFCRTGRRVQAYEFEEDEWIPGDLATR